MSWVGIIGTHRSTDSLRIQFWSWFNITLKRINCTPVPYVNNSKTKFGSITYYQTCKLFINWCLWSNKVVLYLLRSPFKSLSYISHLLCDQLKCSNFNKHMSNSNKGIIVVTNFIIICPLDHLRGHVVSIPWDIMVPLLRIPVATSLYRQSPYL